MLDPSQHGFRANHGTDSASLLLIDALEHAKETHTACLVSSWDIRRAFDSISKPALQMAWTRLGVPPPNGPHSSSNSTLKASPPYGSRSRNLPTTKQDRQACPACAPSERPIYYSQLNEESPKEISPALLGGTQSMISYSELSQSNADLLQTQPRKPLPTLTTSSVSSTLASLQQQADLVAAFAAIFELDLAHAKFRAYEFPYHRTHANQPQSPPPHSTSKQCRHPAPTNRNTHIPGQPI